MPLFLKCFLAVLFGAFIGSCLVWLYALATTLAA
jgi:hypothetical protein